MEVSRRVIETEEKQSSEALGMSLFHQRSHFWGRVTIWTVILLTISLPFTLSFYLGYHPGWQPILTGFFAYASVIGVIWFVEPISYYPTLGVSGTYMAFLTGNIANMCLPSAAAAQNAIGTDLGSKKGEITAALAIGAASIVNLVFLILIILGGSYVLSIIPESVKSVFPYIVPSIFGGIFAQFALKKPLYGGIAISIALLLYLLSIPTLIKGLLCIICTVSIVLVIEKKKLKNKVA